jgi:hypothetical protein
LAKLTRIYDLEEKRKGGDDDIAASTISSRHYEDMPSRLPPNENLLNHSINLLTYISKILIVNESEKNLTKLSKERIEEINAEQFLIESVSRLENCLNTMRTKNMFTNSNVDNDEEYSADRLPNLQLSAKVNQNTNNKTIDSKTNSLNQSQRQGRNMQLIESFTNSELVSSSVISNSNTGDLSEDEQINYYDENEDDNGSDIDQDDVEDLVASKTRCLSNSSDGTLIVMPNNATITKTVNFLDAKHIENTKTSSNSTNRVSFEGLDPDADDEEETNHPMVIKFKNRKSLHQNEETVNNVENTDDSDENDSESHNSNHLIHLAIDPLAFRAEEKPSDMQPTYYKQPYKEHIEASIINSNPKFYINQNERRNEVLDEKSQSYYVKNNQYLDSNSQNDLSDDEVKDYQVFKENCEDDSQA